MIRREAAVIWPSYFSKSLSREEGRRVPLRLAVRNPSREDVAEAVESLGMKAEVEEGAHPSTCWNRTGKVLVTMRKKMTKERLIRTIARKLMENEEKRLSEREGEKSKLRGHGKRGGT